MLSFERAFFAEHPGQVLAGVDEAGRGPLAGPVLAAAVSMTQQTAEALYAEALREINDSKQLRESKREAFFKILTAHPDVFIGIGQASPVEIDEINILAATHRAMQRAIADLSKRCPPQHVLIDGLPVPGLPCGSTAIVKGDCLSFLIASASVIAKVTRDRLMRRLDRRYPVYEFSGNKGYGTHAHMRALLQYGPCPEHRTCFRPVQEALRLFKNDPIRPAEDAG